MMPPFKTGLKEDTRPDGDEGRGMQVVVKISQVQPLPAGPRGIAPGVKVNGEGRTS